jgi:hypothetical protein
MGKNFTSKNHFSLTIWVSYYNDSISKDKGSGYVAIMREMRNALYLVNLRFLETGLEKRL